MKSGHFATGNVERGKGGFRILRQTAAACRGAAQNSTVLIEDTRAVTAHGSGGACAVFPPVPRL